MTPNRSARRGQIQPLAALALGAAAIVAIVAAILISRPATPAPATPTAPPSAAPSVVPSVAPATPVPSPTASPTSDPLTIELENATDHDVTLKVQDPDGVVTGVRSGQPGDGMSVRWHDSLVKNVDADTIAVTFVGLPLDEQVDMVVDAASGKVTITIVQAGPVPQSDALGADRIVILSFETAVSADNVSVEILDRTVDA